MLGPANPNRFRTSRATLLMDRFMTGFIKLGGVSIILAVMAIFIFIFLQIVPLFRGAKVAELESLSLPVPAATVAALGIDEWGHVPALVDRTGAIWQMDLNDYVIDAAGRPVLRSGAPASTRSSLNLSEGDHITVAAFDALAGVFNIGTATGAVFSIPLKFWVSATIRVPDGHDPAHQQPLVVSSASAAGHLPRGHDEYIIAGRLGAREDIAVGQAGLPVVALARDGMIDASIAAVIQRDQDGRHRVFTRLYERSVGLMGGGEFAPGAAVELTDKISGQAERILVDHRGESVLVATKEGDVFYFFLKNGAFEHRQTFRPFDASGDPRIATFDFIFGGVSLCLTSAQGVNEIYSLFRKDGSEVRQFGRTGTLPVLPHPATAYAPSVRNKCFALSGPGELSIRHSTSGTIRWQAEIPYEPQQVVLNAKFDHLAAVGADNRLHRYAVVDHHPEASFGAFFSKIHYEGYDEPRYEWQSTGGADDSEPKLSLIPLIFGTLKATFYAMLFAVPIAILGAMYTAEFMHPRFRTIIKPTVELMASLPSVVLGFIAASWLAPRIEFATPGIMLAVLAVPLAAIGFGWWWSRLSMNWRSRITPGYEYLVFMPIIALVAMAAWSCGPLFERLAFDGDFKAWWQAWSGVYPDQRNSLVVGIAMGFAVIPIIFTITEDALSNVPKTLRSGSLALGASRWQTAWSVVLPTASPGVFAALMIGLGRAIGETMIVVMATGNTALMDFDIFNGMRTLSANIAVEISEAPEGGTLFRTLFLGAFLLFMLTFVVNTAAEVTRQYLREKYKTV